MSRPLRRTLERGRAREAKRDVEALDSLARRALHQVVERGGDDCFSALGRNVDQAEVRVRRELGGRRPLDDLGERLAGVELAIRVAQLLHRAFQVEVAGRKDAADHRHEMRDERHLHLAVPAQGTKLLQDLRKMSVAVDGVGADGFVHLAEVSAQTDGSAAPLTPDLASTTMSEPTRPAETA